MKDEYSTTGMSSVSVPSTSSNMLDVDNQSGLVPPHARPSHTTHSSLTSNPSVAPHNSAHTVPTVNPCPTLTNHYAIPSTTAIKSEYYNLNSYVLCSRSHYSILNFVLHL